MGHKTIMEALCTNGVPCFSHPSGAVGGFLQPRSRLRVHSGRPTSCIALRTRAAAVGDGFKGALPQAQEARQDTAKLKKELFKAIDEAEEGLDDKCLAIIASLEQLRQVPDAVAHPHLLKGCLAGLKAKFKENRRDGKERYLGYTGALSTLGATTFNALKPTDLQIAMSTGHQAVSMDSPDSYVIFVDVGVVDPLGNNPPLLGQIANRARFTTGGSYTLNIEFLSSEIKPKFPEKDRDAWLKVFKEANPGMDENGFVSVPHSKPIKGGTDIIYMDDEIRIHRGHKGGVSVLQLLKEPI